MSKAWTFPSEWSRWPDSGIPTCESIRPTSAAGSCLGRYDFITAWDSIWHVPLAEQGGVLRKLCDGLNSGGVLIFTMGGTDQPGEVQDTHMGVPMYTATLGIPKMLSLLAECGCVCRHLEYDQHPQLHVYVIAQKA
jgi:hypothetical protein